MIDKEHIERCYKFFKQFGVTEFERANSGLLNSYAEVNYSVFETAGNDYHNELYGYLESTDEVMKAEAKTSWTNYKKRYNAKLKKNDLPRFLCQSTSDIQFTTLRIEITRVYRKGSLADIYRNDAKFGCGKKRRYLISSKTANES